MERYMLSNTQIKARKHLIPKGNLTNALDHKMNHVSKATATRDLQDLVKQQALVAASKGAGATYGLLEAVNKKDTDKSDHDSDLI